MKTRQWMAAELAVLVLCAGAALAQTGTDPEDAVRAADQAWMKVYSAKDLQKTLAFCDEEGSMMAPNSPIATGKAAIAKLVAADFNYGDLVWHADKAGVARSGDIAYTSGTYKFSFKDQSGKPVVDNGKYLTVWKKQKDGSWKVFFDMFNTDLPPA
jgi:ketosteroid isomerase-like protein